MRRYQPCTSWATKPLAPAAAIIGCTRGKTLDEIRKQTKDLSQQLFFVILVALLSTPFTAFSAGPILIAHIILIHLQRFTHDFRTVFVAPPFNLRLIILLGLVAHIILIHLQRLTHDFRTALVALLSTLRLIVLLGLIATLSAFSVLHLGLQGPPFAFTSERTRPPM